MFSNTRTWTVEWGDCDPAGIVFNPRYFAFFDHGSALLLEAAGWRKPDLIKTFDIIGLPLVETTAKFLAPCTFGDDVRIVSEVFHVGRSSFKIRHSLFRDDILCVEGAEVRVWAVQDETGRMRAAPLPEVVSRRLKSEGQASAT